LKASPDILGDPELRDLRYRVSALLPDLSARGAGRHEGHTHLADEYTDSGFNTEHFADLGFAVPAVTKVSRPS